jgi:hypothetical protein
MVLTWFMIVFCFLNILIAIYLALGLISPELGISIDIKIRKALRRQPVIVLDPWYIRKRNAKWLFWLIVLFQVIIFASIYITGQL